MMLHARRTQCTLGVQEKVIWSDLMTLARSWHGWRSHRGRGAPHGRTGRGLLLQHGPVEGVVVLVVQRAEKDPANGLLLVCEVNSGPKESRT